MFAEIVGADGIAGSGDSSSHYGEGSDIFGWRGVGSRSAWI